MAPIKAMTGHTLGGRDLLSPLIAVLAVKERKVPPVLIDGIARQIEGKTCRLH